MEKLKDFLYEISDVLFGLLVLAAVIFVFVHQLQNFFSPEMITTGSMSSVESSEEMPPTDSPDLLPQKTPAEETPAMPPKNDPVKVQEGIQTEEQPGTVTVEEPTGERIDIVIPPGATSESIAVLLHQQGLISSESQFITTLIARKLDTKLKAGTFSIPKGSSLDQVIEILTK